MKENQNSPEKKYIVPAVDQAARIMLCLSQNGNRPASLIDICRETSIHKSKAYSILETLSLYGFVNRVPNRGGYVLGPGLLTVAGRILDNLSLPRQVEPLLTNLARKTRATVTMGIVSGDRTYIVAEYAGAPGPGISSPVGQVSPLSYGSHGKAIAACLPQDELAELLKNDQLYFYGNPDMYNQVRFNQELLECRRSGFALELGDIQKGINAAAAAILDQTGYPIGYITVVGFFSEEDARRFGPLVVEAARQIARDAGQLILWQKANRQRMLF